MPESYLNVNLLNTYVFQIEDKSFVPFFSQSEEVAPPVKTNHFLIFINFLLHEEISRLRLNEPEVLFGGSQEEQLLLEEDKVIDGLLVGELIGLGE